MKKIKLILLTLLVPCVVLAQSEDAPMPQGLAANPLLCQRNSAGASLTSTDGDASYIGCSSTGAVLMSAGTGASDFAKAEDSAHTTGDVAVPALCRVTATAVGSTSTAGDYGTCNVTSDGKLWTTASGSVGHGQTSVDNPQVMGSVAATSNPGGFTAGLVMQNLMDILGRQVTAPYALVGRSVSGVTASDITDTTSTSVIAAQGANVRTYLTSVTITNSDATVGTDVVILDGATRRWVCSAAALNGGCVVTFPFALRGTANTAWNCQPVTTSAQINCSFAGYTALD